jgi:hypothetical protein
MEAQVCPKDERERELPVPVEGAVRRPPFRRISTCHRGGKPSIESCLPGLPFIEKPVPLNRDDPISSSFS